MIVLDASALIPVFDRLDEWHTRSRDLLAAHLEEGFAISALTLAEALVHQATLGTATQAADLVKAMGITAFPVPSKAALELAAIRAKTGLRMPDTVVLHLAQSFGALATWDTKLASAARAAGLTVLDQLPDSA
ncbi:MAG: type II toxin-antitoxin system VapC family toxin [Bifidobacteriaceae bacterium]|jgi:predicted nucleic acid-binding protein|nr:type II toxin-antitoxin system VapC family toxin [Bifidobacteriaceae bacterium]